MFGAEHDSANLFLGNQVGIAESVAATPCFGEKILAITFFRQGIFLFLTRRGLIGVILIDETGGLNA